MRAQMKFVRQVVELAKTIAGDNSSTDISMLKIVSPRLLSITPEEDRKSSVSVLDLLWSKTAPNICTSTQISFSEALIPPFSKFRNSAVRKYNRNALKIMMRRLSANSAQNSPRLFDSLEWLKAQVQKRFRD